MIKIKNKYTYLIKSLKKYKYLKTENKMNI